jgi:hypothetical protein
MRLYEGVLGRLPGSIKTNVLAFSKVAAKVSWPATVIEEATDKRSMSTSDYSIVSIYAHYWRDPTLVRAYRDIKY